RGGDGVGGVMAKTVRFAYLIEPPFNFRDGQGALTGCDITLARTALASCGYGIEFIEAEFAELLPGLAAGRWEMTTGLFATKERAAMAAFSRPIWALQDGLLVAKGHPRGVSGYRSAAATPGFRMAVVRDQVQEQDARRAGFSDARLVVCETYAEAARAVIAGAADGYASVARAHAGYLAQNPGPDLEIVTVAATEKAPAFGCFGFRRDDAALREAVDGFLSHYIGSSAHRVMMRGFGFGDEEIGMVLS
ncbi:MAG: transporter substrate-binding domain-containing protein, partial [Paracoccaceae bacterium]